MTSLVPHVLYKYEAPASPKYHLFTLHLYRSQTETSYRCEPPTNSSISIDLLCNTLISIICAKIASHSRGLSSI